jgi:hypothetical protein
MVRADSERLCASDEGQSKINVAQNEDADQGSGPSQIAKGLKLDFRVHIGQI